MTPVERNSSRRREHITKCLRRAVNGFVWRGQGRRNRGGDENPAAAVLDHMLDDAFGHMDGPGYIDRKQAKLILEIVIDKGAANTDTDVQSRGFQGAPQPVRKGPEPLDAIVRRGIRFERICFGIKAS